VYRCNNDGGPSYFYDESEADDDVKSMKKKKPQRKRGENFDRHTKVEHVVFNIAHEYGIVKEFRVCDYIAIQG